MLDNLPPAELAPGHCHRCNSLSLSLTLSLSFPQPVTSISYPSLDEQLPGSEEGGGAVGTLIDLGSDITTPVPSQKEGEAGGGADIVSQLAEMGIATGGQPAAAPVQPQPRDVEQTTDEFDIFAKSRTAYADAARYC